LYGILAVVGIVHVFIYLPDTEGKTLSEIEKDFARKNAR
jgi:hypothetical protein